MRALVIATLLGACAEQGDVRTAPLAGTDSSPGTGVPVGSPTGGTPSGTETSPCPAWMVFIAGDAADFCIDQYEATLDGWSPYEVPAGVQIATVAPGVVPQGYISGESAAEACEQAGKRLCDVEEWLRACRGPAGTLYPYGDVEDPGRCNTSRAGHPVVDLFGADTDWSPTQMNDPRINQQADTVAAGGAYAGCVSAEGVFDLHGNLHEWTRDPAGTFNGGFYADASINGPGCTYQTTAHSYQYHDYSTGFRCCSDP